MHSYSPHLDLHVVEHIRLSIGKGDNYNTCTFNAKKYMYMYKPIQCFVDVLYKYICIDLLDLNFYVYVICIIVQSANAHITRSSKMGYVTKSFEAEKPTQKAKIMKKL